MSATRYNRLQKATALVPLALLSAAWTVNVTGLTQSSATASGTRYDDAFSLPDGTSVPAEAIEAPASVSASTNQGDKSLPGTASTAGIPSAALAAYQRAATVINAADPSCRIDWPLIAAIGRVESNHGRANGNRLTAEGISTPGIYGVPLNGKGNVAQINDTDGGQYDGDTAFDRAIGPMQFIPSTWAMVGVDADGDGKRNPQDINDAALASAVYLCSGDDDLSTDQGARAAVFRYNHSQTYVTTVLAVAEAYRSGDFTSIPNNTVPVDYAIPRMEAPEPARKKDRQVRAGGQKTGPRGDASQAPSDPATEEPTQEVPGGDTGGGGTGGDAGDTAGDAGEAVTEPLKETVETVLATPAQVRAACESELAKYPLLNASQSGQALSQCVDAMAGKTLEQVNATVTNVLTLILKGILGSLFGALTGN